MPEFFQIGPQGTVHIYGIKLVGVNAENAGKLLITLVFILLALLLRKAFRSAVRWLLRLLISGRQSFSFWASSRSGSMIRRGWPRD